MCYCWNHVNAIWEVPDPKDLKVWDINFYSLKDYAVDNLIWNQSGFRNRSGN